MLLLFLKQLGRWARRFNLFEAPMAAANKAARSLRLPRVQCSGHASLNSQTFHAPLCRNFVTSQGTPRLNGLQARSLSTAGLTGLRATFARLAAERLGLPVEAPSAAPAAPAPAVGKAPAAVSVGEGCTERRVPVSFVRQRVMKRLKETQNTTAQLSTFQEVDMTESLKLRSKYKDLFLKLHGSQLGLLSLIAKATCLAIAEVPGVNAIIDDGTKETVWRDYVDISIPIPSPRGIISCTLKDAQSMTIRDLEHEIAALSDRAGRDELSVSDLSHSTFGIVDTGAAGSMLGTGIINYPQSASMGTNAVKRRVAVVGGKLEARPIMYTALNYDHRLVDGREAVTFLCSVRDKLEDPSRMLLDL